MPGEFMAIGESSFDQILTKRLVGPGGSLAPGVAPEVFPVMVIENDRPEWQYLYGGRRYAVEFDTTPAAGESAMIRFRAQRDSSLLAVIETFDLLVGAAASITLERSLDSETTLTPLIGKVLDLRVFQDPVAGGGDSQLRVSQGSSPASGITNPITIYRWPTVAAAARSFTAGIPIILAPGTCVNLRVSAAATRLAGTVTWRERYLNNTER